MALDTNRAKHCIYWPLKATLQAQALGALINHSEFTTAPQLRLLDDVAAFESAQFSSPAVQLLSEAGGVIVYQLITPPV